MSQASVLGIGGVPHELGDPRPVGLGADARDLTAAAGQVNQDQHGDAGQAAWRPDLESAAVGGSEHVPVGRKKLPPGLSDRGLLDLDFGMLGVDLTAPDHTTLSRRGQHLALALRRARPGTSLHLIVDSTGLSIVGEGEWAAATHGGRGRRGWRKLHLGVDGSRVIVAGALTEPTAG